MTVEEYMEELSQLLTGLHAEKGAISAKRDYLDAMEAMLTKQIEALQFVIAYMEAKASEPSEPPPE